MCPALVISMKSEASIILHCQLITQQYCSKSPSVIKVATVKNTDDFCYAKKATTKLTPFAVSKDVWNTNKDTGKSMKNVLYVLRYAKRCQSG